MPPSHHRTWHLARPSRQCTRWRPVTVCACRHMSRCKEIPLMPAAVTVQTIMSIISEIQIEEPKGFSEIDCTVAVGRREGRRRHDSLVTLTLCLVSMLLLYLVLIERRGVYLNSPQTFWQVTNPSGITGSSGHDLATGSMGERSIKAA